jgi:septal ring factor EnvC (AmiA/AmiB activator)
VRAPLLAAASLLLALPCPAQQRDVTSLLREEKSVLDALDRYVFEARKAEAAMKAAEASKATTEQRLATAARAHEVATARADAARARLAGTLRLVAAASPYGTAATLFLGPDGDDVVRRKALADRLAARQGRELAELTKVSDEAAAAQLRAGIERANAHATAAAEREARARLEEETAARRALLDALDKDRQLAQRHATELAAADRAMVEDIVARLSRKPAPVPFETLKGRVRNPLAGARVAVPFGDIVHPRFKTITPHPGVTLAFPGDSRNVRSVAFGKVAFVGMMRGFGLTVVVDHASGWFTVYAGLGGASASQGYVVREGDLLGRVERAPGDDTARLYFELRRGTEAIDPAPYLAGEKRE